MSYSPEWAAGPVLLGALVVFPLAPPFALIALGVVALAALAALVALAALILASPYLLVRGARRHLAAGATTPETSNTTDDELIARVLTRAEPTGNSKEAL
jgi:hypothetical protein